MKSAISQQIKDLRLGRGLKQSDLDHIAGMPKNSTSKVERGERELSAEELVRIAGGLGLSLDSFTASSSLVVSANEAILIRAMRELSIEDCQQILRTVEARLYYQSKDAQGTKKIHLKTFVSELSAISARSPSLKSQAKAEVHK
jgi:transcriptional regulator with XRE-family HTH domain